MPELPEVHSLMIALKPHLMNATVQQVDIRTPKLRYPISRFDLEKILINQTVRSLERRGKYIILTTEKGHTLFHLGMTGNILILDSSTPQYKHTHLIIQFLTHRGATQYLHFVDPRRFGFIQTSAPKTLEQNKFLRNLGPEPLKTTNLGSHLFKAARKKSQPIKNFLMDAHNVVGIGNIYACEALFKAKINPLRKAQSISLASMNVLARHVQKTLTSAIDAGGTTFRDFKLAHGETGTYKISLKVYDRKGAPCHRCREPIVVKRLAGRSTFFCPSCQK